MPKHYTMVTSMDNGIPVQRPKLTAAGHADLGSAEGELVADGVYTEDEIPQIFDKGLERFFRKPKSGPTAIWDKFLAVGKARGKTEAEIIAIIGPRPTQ